MEDKELIVQQIVDEYIDWNESWKDYEDKKIDTKPETYIQFVSRVAKLLEDK